MQATHRILPALVLAALLALTGCKTAERAEPPATEPPAVETPATETPAAETPDDDAPVPEGDITYAATGVRPDKIIAELDGNTAPAELLTYQIGYSCAYLDYTMQSYDMGPLDLDADLPNGENAAQYIRTESLTLVKQQLAVENLAARYGVTVSPEDEEELAEQRAADLLEHGEDGYREEVRKLGLSEAGYERVQRAGYLYRALAAASRDPESPLYQPEETLADYARAEGYLTADHILLSFLDPLTREPLEDGVVAEKRAQAEALLQQLRDADDPVALFDQLADRYGEDPGRRGNPQGYTFGSGEMVEPFENAARALAENEYSDLVETEYGVHIILRRPLDAAAAAEAVRDAYFDSYFLAEVERAELKLTLDIEKMDVAAIYGAIRAAQGETCTATAFTFAQRRGQERNCP